jgi:hypothetical protein
MQLWPIADGYWKIQKNRRGISREGSILKNFRV